MARQVPVAGRTWPGRHMVRTGRADSSPAGTSWLDETAQLVTQMAVASRRVPIHQTYT